MSGRRRKRQDQGNENRNNSSKNDDGPDAPPKSKRPAPPPPAPKALLNVLKKNKSALAYFTSLQENLDYDVQKWKDRAGYYKSLYEKEHEENARLKALRVAAATNQQDNGFGVTADPRGEEQKQKAHLADDSVGNFSQNDADQTGPLGEKLGDLESGKNEAQAKEQPRTINADAAGANIGDSDFDIVSSDDENSTEKKTDRSFEKHSYQNDNDNKAKKSIEDDGKAKHEIDQSMLDLFSSDDDEATDDSDARGTNVKKQRTGSMSDDGSGYKPFHSYDEKSGTINDEQAQSAPPFWQKHKVHIMEELIDAYQCLKYLGVELVTKNAINNDEKWDEQGTLAAEVDRVDGNGAAKEPLEEHNEHAAESDEEQEEFFSFLPGQQETQAVKRQIATENTTTEVAQGNGLEEATALFERRPNEDVVADMLRALGDLSRIQIHYKGLSEKYNPFRIAPLWIPAGDFLQPEYTDAETADQPDHPIRLAKICIFRALSVMDAFCDSENLSLACCAPSSEDAWNSIFVGLHPGITSEPDLLPAIKVGMRDRKELVDKLIDSLFAEISESWAVSDRSTRIQNDALLYDTIEKIEATGLLESDNAEKKIEGNESTGEVAASSSLHKAAGTKSQPRLSSLIERRILAQITVHLCLLRKDPQKAFQLVHNYLSSTTPSLELEDYPKLQPVLSLVVLEGMLRVDKDLLPVRGRRKSTSESLEDDDEDSEASASWFSQCLSQVHARLYQGELNNFVRQSIGLAIQTTACIWRQRQQSPDDRISDIARVEVASYRRLLVLESMWLSDEYRIDDNEGLQDLFYNAKLFDRCRDAAGSLIDEFRRGFLSKEMHGERFYSREIDSRDLFTVSVTSALHLATVLLGDDDVVMELFSLSTSMINGDPLGASKKQSTEAVAQAVVYACCMTVRQLELRKLDIYRQRVGCFVNPDISDKFARTECLSGLLRLLRAADQSLAWHLAATTLDCCRLLSDGEAANEVIELLVQLDGSIRKTKVSPVLNRVFEAIEKAAKVPTVRVINLKRRSDRMDSMMSHVLQSSVLVLKAVTTMDDSNGSNYDTTGLTRFFHYGRHAIDGVLTKGDKIADQIIDTSGATQNLGRLLEAYVAAQWRPHDLKPFDINANPDETALLRISDSERACALSHISAWKGVLRSLTVSPPKTKGNLFEDSESVQRLFRHSGFARGQALHPENSSMPPSAVCVILEDDAILVERFVERLDRLLEELPRDFHFCSLGYSRPRTAPLVKFSSQLGIPTCIWYLTGYIISLEGAKHLISSLPVRGPVDSWIGLKMCANWDNSFGEMVGVGVNSKPFEEAPARKELAQIITFRAFAALVPLCNQRVGTNLSTAGVSERNWRQRDTDIIYSGSENYRNK